MARELLFSLTEKDFEVQRLKAGGKGGQHQNKTDSAVRIIHKESRAVGISRSDRSQHRNKKIAFQRLINDKVFKAWTHRKIFEVSNNIKVTGDKGDFKGEFKESDLKIEKWNGRKWVEEIK